MEQNKGDHFVIQRGKRTRGMEIDTPLPGGESVMRLSFTPELRGVIWETLEDSGNMILAVAVATDDIQVKNKSEYLGRTMLIHKEEFSLEPVGKELVNEFKKKNKSGDGYMNIDDIRNALQGD